MEGFRAWQYENKEGCSVLNRLILECFGFKIFDFLACFWNLKVAIGIFAKFVMKYVNKIQSEYVANIKMSKKVTWLFVLLFTFCFMPETKGQDTVVLKYKKLRILKVGGPGFERAEFNSSYVIGKDRKGRKRIEGRLHRESPVYDGRVVEYYKNGNIKVIKYFYKFLPPGKTDLKYGVWKYYSEDGRLVKEENYD